MKGVGEWKEHALASPTRKRQRARFIDVINHELKKVQKGRQCVKIKIVSLLVLSLFIRLSGRFRVALLKSLSWVSL